MPDLQLAMKKTTVKNTTNKTTTTSKRGKKVVNPAAAVAEQTKDSVTMPIEDNVTDAAPVVDTNTDDVNLLLAAAIGDNNNEEVTNEGEVKSEDKEAAPAATAEVVAAAVLPAKQRTNFGNLPKSGEGVNAVELVAYLQSCVEKGILRNANSGLPFLNMANEEVKWINNCNGFPAVELIKGKTKKGLPVKQSYWLHVLGTYLIVDNVTVVPMAIPAPAVAAEPTSTDVSDSAPAEPVIAENKEIEMAG